MSRLPDRPNLDHLKKQAKDLIRRWRARDPEAFARLRRALPAAAARSDAEIAALGLRLHDAQSCVARDHGFASWTDLARYVAARSASCEDRAALALQFLRLVYCGDIAGTLDRANPRVAVRMLAENPDLAAAGSAIACAIGDEAALRRAAAADPAWIRRAGGPLKLPPLVAVAHSSLIRIAEFGARLRGSARFLLAAGADPNQKVGNRWPPASLDKPDESQPLSALYGAAGSNCDPELTALLLDAGADPDDGESLYHSLENSRCTRLLLAKGARIVGTNALYRALDLEDAAALELLLAHGADPNEPARNPPLTHWGSPLLRAIGLRRSPRHVAALLGAGADPTAKTPDGVGAFRLAQQLGLGEVVELLEEKGLAEPLDEAERFVAACARGDAAEARRIRAARPDLPGALPAARLRTLPDMVAAGGEAAARLMVDLGWPITARGADWDATALNLAVFRGDAALTRFLLERGARWTETQGFGDNVCGTLGWASCNAPVADGDWPACARALLAHGMPTGARDPDDSERIVIEGRARRFSEEVADVLSEGGAAG